MISVECSVAEAPPFHGEDEAELRACANGLLDMVSIPDLYAAIDAASVKLRVALGRRLNRQRTLRREHANRRLRLWPRDDRHLPLPAWSH